MASTSQLVQMAKSLPEPLQRFLARWPPAAIVAAGAPPTAFQEIRVNPFEFYKHPVTGRLQDPVYSARRQAQLIKLAREHGVEELLPASRKNPEQRLAHRVEHGLRVKGTGVGQKVKGHIHERHMIAKYVLSCFKSARCGFWRAREIEILTIIVCRMEQRRKAMLEMPQLIKAWKTVRSLFFWASHFIAAYKVANHVE